MKAVIQFAKETRVKVNPLVFRAIKGAGCRLGKAAARLCRFREKHEVRLTIRPAEGPELIAPDILGVFQDDGDKLSLLVVKLRPRLRPAGYHRACLRWRRPLVH